MKDAGERILVVDSGNLLFRTPRVREAIKDQAIQTADLIVKAFDEMGCDAFNIGYYDLSMGKDFLLERQRHIRFPFLSANLVDEKTGKLLFKPYVIKEINGVRVGIFGLATNRFKVADLRIEEPIEVATRVVHELRNKRCHLIIALTQMEPKKDLELAQEVEGVNFIICAQNVPFRQMDTTPKKVNRTTVVQAGNRGRHLGRLDITVVDDTYRFVNYSEKSGILSQLETLRGQIELFGQGLSSSSDRKRIRKALKTFDKVVKQMGKVEGGSHYINTAIPMDKNINRNPDIETMVRQYKALIAKMRKQKLRSIPAQRDMQGEQDEKLHDLTD